MPILPTLTTPRLVLRPLELADAEQAQRIFPQWEVVKYLTSHIPWPFPADGALTHYRDVALPAIENGTAWGWSIRPKSEPARLIGTISLTDQENDNRGFWLDPHWRRQGLMTEACEAATDYWFEVLDRPLLRAPKAVANLGSRRISERSGMRVIATLERDYVSGRQPAEIWEITQGEWRARRL